MPKKTRSKAEIREFIKNKRDKFSLEKKQKSDKKIFTKLTNSKLWKDSKTILFYVSYKNEVDTNALIKTAFKTKSVIVPKSHTKTNTLTLHRIETFNNLHIKNYGINEPKSGTIKVTADQIDLAIIPGIAFDLKGHRIGYGKAYYDKLNRKLKCPKIGLAYNFQVINNIPAEPHDEPVNKIITDEKIIDCNN